MFGFRMLPWDYGIRNLFRRPARTAITLAGLTLVVTLVLVVVAFLRGLETSLAVSGDPRVVLVHTLGTQENIENSSIAARTTALLSASLDAIERRAGPGQSQHVHVSPELYLGTQVNFTAQGDGALGLVRGITPAALLVRRNLQLVAGNWPGPGEVLVGRLAATKLGRAAGDVAIGRTVWFEDRAWKISGQFAALGSALEAELWCPLEDLQQAMKRQDLSLVALVLAPQAAFADIDEFCKERVDLEVQATAEEAYYEALQRHYGPVRGLAWLMVLLLAGAGMLAGLNTMYGAVAGRVRELATLQTLGFSRRAIALALIQEGALLAAAASLTAALVAIVLIHGTAIRFTMGAFTLQVDSLALLVGCGAGIFLGVIGSIPPALMAMRLCVADGLKAI